jgi:hypothetical protein
MAMLMLVGRNRLRRDGGVHGDIVARSLVDYGWSFAGDR